MANSRCALGCALARSSASHSRRIRRIFLRALNPVDDDADGAEDVPAATWARVSALHEHRLVGFDACPSALLWACRLAAPAHLMADGRSPRWPSPGTGRRSAPPTIAPGADWLDRGAPCPVAVELSLIHI